MSPQRAGPDPRRALLLGAAVLVLAAAVLVDPTGLPWAAAAGLTALGIVGGLLERRRSVPAAVRAGLAATGAVAVVAGPGAGAWSALLVGVTVVGAARPPRDGATDTALMVLGAAGAGGAAVAAERLLSVPPVVTGGAVLGSPGVQVGWVTALAGSLAVLLALSLFRHGRRWVDRRHGPPGPRWGGDLAAAAVTALAPVVWAAAPVLVPVLLAPLLGGRAADGLSGPDEGSEGPLTGLLRVGVIAAVRRATVWEQPVAVLHVLVDPPGDGEEVAEPLVGQVEQALAGAIREYDVAGRAGPTSFTVVLPDADREIAERVADRLHEAVRAADGAPRVSVGLATYPDDAREREALLVEAETAAASARAQGGDRTVPVDRVSAGFREATATPGDRPGEDRVDQPVAGDSLVRVAATSLDEGGEDSRVLLWGVVGVAVLVGVAGLGLGRARAVDPVDLAVFAGLALVAEVFAAAVADRAAVSWTTVPLVAAATVAGASPVTVVGAAVVAGLAGGVARGVRARQMAFNTAVFVLSGLAALAIAVVLPLGDGLGPTVVAGLAGGVAFVAVNTVLVMAAVTTSFPARPAEVWRLDLGWLVPHQLGMALLGGVLAFVEMTLGPAGAVLLALPAAGLHLTLRRGLARTSRMVARLREHAEELSATRDRATAVNRRLTGALARTNRGYLEALDTVADLVDRRDAYQGPHVDRVVAYGRRVLELLDPTLASDEALLWAFRLHDIGKIHLPDDLLEDPGPLSETQWDLVRQHPRLGVELIEGAPFLERAREVILHHHERWDGSGYPFGLRGPAIPLPARVLAVVDAFDAMTSDRPYRAALGFEEALHEVVRGRGGRYDPDVVDAFLQLPPEELRSLRARVDEGAPRSPSTLWLGFGLSQVGQVGQHLPDGGH